MRGRLRGASLDVSCCWRRTMRAMAELMRAHIAAYLARAEPSPYPTAATAAFTTSFGNAPLHPSVAVFVNDTIVIRRATSTRH